MNDLAMVIRYESWFLIAGLALVVAYKLLTGKINTKGMLYDSDGNFSPGRLQLLVSTVGVAVYYWLEVLKLKESPTQPLSLPGLPTGLMLLLAGSHAFYLGSKLTSLIAEKLDSLLPRLRAESQTQNSGKQNKEAKEDR